MIAMTYTIEDRGRLNNFAREPKMYMAEPPNQDQQRNYIIMGSMALTLVSGLVVLAFAVS